MAVVQRGAAFCLFFAAAAGQAWATSAAQTPCASFLETLAERDPRTPVAPKRNVRALDLAMLRDVGEMGNGSTRDRQPFSISPDGRSVAFIVRQAQPLTNSWCQALVILGLEDGAKPRISYGGNELVRFYHPNLRGMRFPTGLPQLIVPQWAPDGQSVAYLRRENGRTQVWRADARGGDARAATNEQVDVEQFAWNNEGGGFILGLAQGLANWDKEIDREGLAGFHYDERMMPMARKRPLPPSLLTIRHIVVAPTGSRRDASRQEVAQLGPLPSVANSTKPVSEVTTPDGTRVWLEAEKKNDISAPPRPVMGKVGGHRASCEAAACQGRITGLWWDTVADSLLYIRQEGEYQLALYRWRGGQTTPRRLFVTQDLLTGCALVKRALLCAREAARQPRTLSWIDVETGRPRQLFDPNPEFRTMRLGEARTLSWTNTNGLPAFAILVLPPDHRTGEKHPLIIVQYTARGFLRGGVGDEYPIQAFAARGYAVLVVQRPDEYAAIAGKTLSDRTAATTVNVAGWAERRNINASLMAVARRLRSPVGVNFDGR